MKIPKPDEDLVPEPRSSGGNHETLDIEPISRGIAI